MTLKKGKKYDVSSLRLTGWTKGDGSGSLGYNMYDYFTASGEYLGVDEHRIAPKVIRVRGNPHNQRKRKGTKAERAVRAQKAAAKRRVAVALAKYLKQANPGKKQPVAVRVKKLKGGGVTITPVKLLRQNPHPARDRMWEVYAGDYGFGAELVGTVSAKTKAEAMKKARAEFGYAPHGYGGRSIVQKVYVQESRFH